MMAGYQPVAILALLAGMLVLFAIGRVRAEVVALAGLSLAVVLGMVSPEGMFDGLTNPAFITVVEILLITQVLGRSGLLDGIARRIPETARGLTGVLFLLTGMSAGLSVFMNNIGALALMLPVVASVGRVTGYSERQLLMPVSFAALLGGLCSMIGTPANLLVSRQLEQATGQPFGFFDFAYVGVPAALVGLGLIIFLWRGGASDTRASLPPVPPQHLRDAAAELRIPENSPLVGMPVSDFPLDIRSMRRGASPVLFHRAGERFEAGDIVFVSGAFAEIDDMVSGGSAAFAHAPAGGNKTFVEAVVMPESPLVGSTVGLLASLRTRDIVVTAVSSQSAGLEQRFDEIRLAIGDVLYLSGDPDALTDAAGDAEILPLWPREAKPVRKRRLVPAFVFLTGIVIASTGLLAPQHAFGLVVIALAATGDLDLRKAISNLDWSILIMLAAMIPLGEAVGDTGAAAYLAEAMASLVSTNSPPMLWAAMLVTALVITPFVNNASTAIILGPVAIGLAQATETAPEPLLMAVAIGASIDFLTPIGHHNNTIVMGVAGYRFVDFTRAGWPLTLGVSVTAILAIALWWH